ncbi:MAG: fibronectin type III-like domain-contianing protein, partial [Alistipes sp.]|nr:fibronectin type III-like domain-contianing protein [Candidatus Minthomonas equi]
PFNDYQVSNGRTYKYLEDEPLYEFGYGLSYTTFEYSGLKVSHRGKGWNVCFSIENTGDRAGDEVAQVYVRIPDYEGKSPLKELKGFSRVSLQPGEKKNIKIFIPDSKLRYWSESEHKFKYSSLKPDIMVGSSSSDIRLT